MSDEQVDLRLHLSHVKDESKGYIWRKYVCTFLREFLLFRRYDEGIRYAMIR